jgi:hypothetical protein
LLPIGDQIEFIDLHQLQRLVRRSRMTLSYRKRGDVWHCRGSVRVARRTFEVREFSRGCADKSDAEAVGATEEARIRTEFINTGNVAEPFKTVTIKNCMA